MPDVNLLNIEPDRLFEQCTINEIIDINKKLQAEIDKKRQELRCMVGERYRDVITAADTIKSMQNCAEKLKTHIHDINTKCYEIQNSTDQEEPKVVAVDKWKNFYRSIAIQIKILILIPEYIWTCLDEGDYLKAVQLYLLAIHIHTGLELDTEHKVSENFTILSRLRISVGSFRNRILDGIKRRLKDVKLIPKEASSHICAYILLENQTQESVLKVFIELRQNSLQTLLDSEILLHSVVRSRILNLTHCLMCTIDLLHSCFIGNDKTSDVLVSNRLQSLLSKDSEKIVKLIDLEPTPLLDYLPSIVSEFRPSCAASEVVLPEETVKNATKAWLDWTSNILNTDLSKSLDVITSVKALHTIREEAFKIEPPINWNQVCVDTYLPNKFNVWLHFFQPLVAKRAEELVCRRIKTSLKFIFEKISDNLSTGDEKEKDLRWYVWSENVNDLGKDSNSHVGLAMKTKGYSPNIVELCQVLDRTYLELLQDVSLYLYGTEDHIESEVDQHCEDGKRLENYLRQQSSASIDRLISHVEKIINSDNEKSVVGARLFQAIPHLCPHLKKCCSKAGTHLDWDEVFVKLTNYSLRFWQHWLTSVLARIDDMCAQILMQDVELSNMLHVLPRWDIIDIEEQTDDKIITSQIRLPMKPSISLLKLLSSINGELNSIVPYTVPKSIHEQFTEGIVALILQRYQHSSEQAAVNQNLALQYLLDVKFLTTICIRRDNKVLVTKSQLICDQLRCKVDPFDLDVFYPYLQNCIKRSVLQSQSLLGCLLGTANQLSNIGVADVQSGQRDPSVLAVSPPSGDVWFPLLPVTAPIAKTLNTAAAQHVPVPTVSSRPPAPPVPASVRAAPPGTTLVRSGAAALFGAMTNDWFS